MQTVMPLPSRSEQVCLASSDVPHMHLALADMHLNSQIYYQAPSSPSTLPCNLAVYQASLSDTQILKADSVLSLLDPSWLD